MRLAANRRSDPISRSAQLLPSRPVYPYSIVRGGAYSATELINALDSDPVAARHYRVFRRTSVHTASSPFSEPVYLSYRVGNEIYWTSRPSRLPRAETLLTDGQNYARARCGNRISRTPQVPVSDTEPAPEMLDKPPPSSTSSVANLDTWSENRLTMEVTSPYAQIAAVQLPAIAVPGSTPPEFVDSSGWFIGTPSGFLYTGGAAVIQPNPIPGLTYPPDVTQPVGEVVPPVVFSQETWPPAPLIPEAPGVPGEPLEPVPEPVLLPVTALALAAIGEFRFQRRP